MSSFRPLPETRVSTLPDGIRHVVVLMLENRSFDHLLGNLPNVSGPAGHSNIDPRDGSTVPVSFDADYSSPALPDPGRPGEMAGDPHHDLIAVNRQLYESDSPGPGSPVTCGGFVTAGRQGGDASADYISREVMRCFDTPRQLQTIAALAADFVVCDRWFSSVPGPTWPNRLFVHAATSFGAIDNRIRLYPGPTIFSALDRAGVEWAVYYHDFPHAACLRGLATHADLKGRASLRPIDEFYKDLRTHRLPAYIFIEPGYFAPSRTIGGRLLDVLKWVAKLIGLPVRPSKSHPNDQHPPHDVRLGEHLIADIYDALRANEDVWQHCLFIVLHDEHGGLFDHEPPPAVSPGRHRSQQPPFNFDRLGPRVPAILVSPFLRQGVDSTSYEHASIVRTVREHFCPGEPPLNPRDAASTPLRRELFTESPRTDAPRPLRRPTAIFAMKGYGDPATRPLNELQTSLVQLADAVPLSPPTAAAAARQPEAFAPAETDVVIDLPVTIRAEGMSEAEGAEFVRRRAAQGRAP